MIIMLLLCFEDYWISSILSGSLRVPSAVGRTAVVGSPLVVSVITEVVIVGATGVSNNINNDNYVIVMFQTLIKSVNRLQQC